MVVITGRTYHLTRDTEYTEHSIHWFLCDEASLQRKAIGFGVHGPFVQAIKDDIRECNPYVGHLQHFRTSDIRRRGIVDVYHRNMSNWAYILCFSTVTHHDIHMHLRRQYFLQRRWNRRHTRRY